MTRGKFSAAPLKNRPKIISPAGPGNGKFMSRIFEPQDREYEARVRQSFDRQMVMKTIKASIDHVLPGKVELRFPYQPEFTQQHGFIHAGIISTVLDSACGYAAYSLMPKDAGVLTIEFKVNLLAPAKGDWFRAVGCVRKAGKNIIVTDGEMFAFINGSSKLVATMMGTMMTVYAREDVQG